MRGEALRVSQSFRVVAPSFEYLFYRFFFELVTKKDSVCVVDVNLLNLKIDCERVPRRIDSPERKSIRDPQCIRLGL